MKDEQSKYEVPAILRADLILRTLARQSSPMSSSDLQKACELPRSTLYLLLDSLEQRRWIEKVDDGYIIGINLYSLGMAYLRQDRLQAVFRMKAQQFVEEHNEVVQLAVLDGSDVVYLGREDAKRPVRLVSDIGSRLPAHACALGKALLAQMKDDEVRDLLPEKLEPITSRTIASRQQLLNELARVRRDGLGLDLEEVAAGLNCFAAFIGRTHLGQSVAVSTSIPTDRLDATRSQKIQHAIVQLAKDIAQGIGR